MNLNELEDALQQINGQLMTEKEMQYVYHVSDLVLLMDISFLKKQTQTHLSVSVIIFISFMKNVNNYYNYVHKFQLSCNKALEVKPRSHRSSALTLWIGPEPI